MVSSLQNFYCQTDFEPAFRHAHRECSRDLYHGISEAASETSLFQSDASEESNHLVNIYRLLPHRHIADSSRYVLDYVVIM